jgi:hypothetical protein
MVLERCHSASEVLGRGCVERLMQWGQGTGLAT